MRKINLLNGIGLFFIILFILGIIVSQVFNVDFVEKNIDDDGRIGEHVKIRVEIFQNQIFYLSLFFGFMGGIALLFQKKIKRIITKRKNVLLNIVLLVSIFIIFFLVGEIVLRIFFSATINSEYGHGPGGKEFMKDIQYNSWGYRDVEHNTHKGENIFRIVIIGDSFTFGSGIDNPEDVYPRLLQKKLDKNYGRGNYEVIKLATGGYSTIDAVKVLNDFALNLSPDLIILGYYINDAEGPKSRVGFEKMYFHHYLYPWEAGSILYTHSYMYYFLESRIKNLFVRLGLGGKNYNNYIVHLYSNSNPFFEEHKNLLKQFIITSKSNEIPLIVLNIPAITSFDNYPFYFVNDYVRNITLQNNATYIDMLHYFSKYNSDELKVSFMDGHMNELGNNITANVLVSFLNEEVITNVK